MKSFKILPTLLITAMLGCSAQKHTTLNSQPQQSNQSLSTEESGKIECNDTNCKIKDYTNVPTDDSTFFRGEGWSVVLPYGWTKEDPYNGDFSAFIETDENYVMAIINVVDYKGTKLKDFARIVVDNINSTPDNEIIDFVMIKMSNIPTLAICYINKKGVIGVITTTLFDGKGYILSCGGAAESKENLTDTLNKCSDFANNLKFHKKS